ncbi:hypothetical protein WJX74_000709 [Apatococcus lobatus]|uniref:HMA domain-containing protein n=2 Tax=Apatococcus TaxID=904362 RepID=A0AAW1SMG8_9CHLO
MALQAVPCPLLGNRTYEVPRHRTPRPQPAAIPAGRRLFRGANPLPERAPCSLWGQRTSPAVAMAVQSADADVEEAMELEISIKGMVCEGCSSRVASALQEMEEVESVKVALDTGIATIQVSADDQLDACFNQLPKMVKTVEGLGFSAEAHFSDQY